MAKKIPFELLCWIGALLFLALTNPEQAHFTICPLALAGFDWCPGCGLGRAVSSLFHGQFGASLHYHWFGIPATAILIHRILMLSKKYLNSLSIHA